MHPGWALSRTLPDPARASSRFACTSGCTPALGRRANSRTVVSHTVSFSSSCPLVCLRAEALQELVQQLNKQLAHPAFRVAARHRPAPVRGPRPSILQPAWPGQARSPNAPRIIHWGKRGWGGGPPTAYPRQAPGTAHARSRQKSITSCRGSRVIAACSRMGMAHGCMALLPLVHSLGGPLRAQMERPAGQEAVPAQTCTKPAASFTACRADRYTLTFA